METLTRRARGRRLVAAALGTLLLLAGTLWGGDDDFPFGPFSMFAGYHGPDEDAPDTRVEGLDATGAAVPLTEQTTGVRRAEIEANEAALRADPARLAALAAAYARRHPGAPAVVVVRVVIRWHEVRDGRPLGTWRDEVVAVWHAT